MLINPLGGRGMVETAIVASFATVEILETIKDTNYSTWGMLELTQLSKYSMGGKLVTA